MLWRKQQDFQRGAYTLQDLTIGVFLNDQLQHWFSVGTDSTRLLPLTKHQGWILLAGSQGNCCYQSDLDFVAVSLDAEILSEVGIDATKELKPFVGTINQLLLQLCLGHYSGADSLFVACGHPPATHTFTHTQHCQSFPSKESFIHTSQYGSYLELCSSDDCQEFEKCMRLLSHSNSHI